MTKELQVELKNKLWYNALLDEIDAAITEYDFTRKMLLIETKYKIGDAILENELRFERAGYGDQKIITLARDLEMKFGKQRSVSDLYKCLEFRQMFPTFDEAVSRLPDGKATSWKKICQEVLVKNPGQRIKALARAKEKRQKECIHFGIQVKCIDCGKIFNEDEVYYEFKEKNKSAVGKRTRHPLEPKNKRKG